MLNQSLRPGARAGLSTLVAILYHPLPPCRQNTLAAAIFSSLTAEKPLGLEYRRLGIVSGEPDLAQVTLCPALLKEAGLLPDGAAVFPVLRALDALPGSVQTTLDVNNRHIPAIVIDPILIRALLTINGSLPPAGIMAVATAGAA